MKIFNYILITSLAIVSVACTDKSPESDDKKNEGKVNPLVPLRWEENCAEAGNVGVTISAGSVEDNNFVFELLPGADVKSYVADVYPLALLYNNLLNDGMVGKTEVEINEKVREYLFASGDVFKDSYSIEIDWMNSQYSANGPLVMPDADYIIAVVACTEDEPSEDSQQDLTICRIHTTSQPLIGNPDGEIKVTRGYTQFSVVHEPNEDAAYCYYFGGFYDEIYDYIDVFGDVMFRDFVRHFHVQPADCSTEEPIGYKTDALPDVKNSTAAVWCDANLTPMATYDIVSFTLEDIPEEAEYATAVCTPIADKIGPSRIFFNIETDMYCQTVYYRLYTEATAKEIIDAGEGSSRQVTEQQSLKRGGLGFNNPNWKWDRTTKRPVGAACQEVLEAAADGFAPETRLRIGYVAKNGYSQLSPIQFSEVFTVPHRDIENMLELTEEEFKVYIDNQKRTSFRFNVNYDPEKVAVVYFQYLTATHCPENYSSSWDREDYTTFMLTPCTTMLGDYCSFNILDINALPTNSSGYEYASYHTMDPATEYIFFCCCEGYDGRISDIKFATVTTGSTEPGPDPQVTAELGEDPSQLARYAVKFSILKDAKSIKTCVVDDASSLADYLSGIKKSDFEDMGNSQYSYDEWKEALYTYCSEYGRESYDDCSELIYSINTEVALCIATGENESGEDIYAFFALVCRNGDSWPLEDLFVE